jgi:phosphotriesterase-related protein
VRTICEPTVLGLGRDIQFIKDVALASGVQVVAATGIYTFDELPPAFASRPIEYMVDAFVHDIQVGIQGTSIRAGFLKCATDEKGVTAGVDKALRAIARAHRKTGVPIMTHSHPGSGTGLAQQDIFEDEGVDLSRVMIGHCGDTDDIAYLEKIAERRSFLGMDRYGLSYFLSTDRRNATVVEMCKLGYSSQMMLSQDYACVMDIEDSPRMLSVRNIWSMTYVLEEVIPELLRLGVKQEGIDNMMVHNVQRWFERHEPY